MGMDKFPCGLFVSLFVPFPVVERGERVQRAEAVNQSRPEQLQRTDFFVPPSMEYFSAFFLFFSTHLQLEKSTSVFTKTKIRVKQLIRPLRNKRLLILESSRNNESDHRAFHYCRHHECPLPL